MDKKIIVVDLDGTFVSVNTFHKWMKFLFKEELKQLHIIQVFKILKVIFSRYTKRITHRKMKFEILQISEKCISDTQIKYFISTLKPYINKTIQNIVQDDRLITILATAAPELYAKYLYKVYHFDYIIATMPSHSAHWKENIREEKKKNLFKLLKKHNLKLKIDILYTDHHDDLPLIKEAKASYLVHPSEKTIRLLENYQNVYILV